MTRRIYFSAIFFILIFILFLFFGCSQKEYPFKYSITNWFENKEAALSISFDDGTDDQIQLGIPLLKKYNLTASFYIITSAVSDWKVWQDAFLNGNEIGSHTQHHYNLRGLSKNDMSNELYISYKKIRQNISGQVCLSIAYPFGGVNEEIVKEAQKYYIAGRTSLAPDTKFNQYEFLQLYKLKAIGLHNESTLQELSNNVEEAILNKGWLIEVIHGIKNSSSSINTGWKPIDFNTLREHFAYLKRKENKIWIAPINKIALYITEKRNFIIYAKKKNENQYELNFSYPKMLCYHPLTIKLKINKKFKLLSIWQNNKKLNFSSIENDYYINISNFNEPIIISIH